jgi:hypothetical protein
MIKRLAALALLCACAHGPDMSARKEDRAFLRTGMTQSAVVAAWGKPETSTNALAKGVVETTWEYDRIYKQKPEITVWPRSRFALTFVDGKLKRWLEVER